MEFNQQFVLVAHSMFWSVFKSFFENLHNNTSKTGASRAELED